jgi:two-component system, NtrC family, nitrogen regulation sensor histidine kinase NtrY
MRKRLLYGSGVLLLAILVTLVVWQGSFSFGEYGPSSPEQTYTVWAVSTLLFLLTVTLGFMLFRNFARLYVERHSSREGSRIRTKLVLGALALSFVPVLFMLLFSVSVLNFNLARWFGRPADDIKIGYVQIGEAIERESHAKAKAQAEFLASRIDFSDPMPGGLQNICVEHGIYEVLLQRPQDGAPIPLCSAKQGTTKRVIAFTKQGDLPVPFTLTVKAEMPINLTRTQMQIAEAVQAYDKLASDRKAMRRAYLLMLALITLFVLFIATWLALFFSKLIIVPISALLGAAKEVSEGNLAARVRVRAIDELATLVRAFNEMTQHLESNSRELENRRLFTEAILESIPTGVISLSSDGRILRINRALRGILDPEQVDRAIRLDHLFSVDDTREIRYLMKRAERLGLAASQLEVERDGKSVQLSITVASLASHVGSGYVVVLEDTSDLLKAQKAAAWHEVARRIAHEIKNPLTPIALCAERIARNLHRASRPEGERILRECSQIISSEVESVRQLVDEFSQFARFPAAQRSPGDLNEVVENALAVFAGRLEGIEVRKQLAPNLPPIGLDRDQFKRLVVNLIDNAAEAMRDSHVKGLLIRTSAPTPETVELLIADTGHGISAEDKEKLFLPYFSTKKRGTGLGLAIVSHIAAEHDSVIRVEDNQPTGACFILEIPAMTATELTLTA